MWLNGKKTVLRCTLNVFWRVTLSAAHWNDGPNGCKVIKQGLYCPRLRDDSQLSRRLLDLCQQDSCDSRFNIYYSPAPVKEFSTCGIFSFFFFFYFFSVAAIFTLEIWGSDLYLQMPCSDCMWKVNLFYWMSVLTSWWSHVSSIPMMFGHTSTQQYVLLYSELLLTFYSFYIKHFNKPPTAFHQNLVKILKSNSAPVQMLGWMSLFVMDQWRTPSFLSTSLLVHVISDEHCFVSFS